MMKQESLRCWSLDNTMSQEQCVGWAREAGGMLELSRGYSHNVVYEDVGRRRTPVRKEADLRAQADRCLGTG